MEANSIHSSLSMPSKALLSVLLTASTCLFPSVFHMDSTFKCNENEFPVTLLGVSDVQRQFHLLSISIVAHHTQAVYRHLISSLQALVSKLLPGMSFSFQYCMTACEAVSRYVWRYVADIPLWNGVQILFLVITFYIHSLNNVISFFLLYLFCISFKSHFWSLPYWLVFLEYNT